MRLTRRVRRLERAARAESTGCTCTPLACETLFPDPPRSNTYPDRPHIICSRCGKPGLRIVVKYGRPPAMPATPPPPPPRDRNATSRERLFSGT